MIKLKFDLPETNIILTTLAQMPYVQIKTLIEKVEKQAKVQVVEPGDKQGPIDFNLDVAEVNGILSALGQMQYGQVKSVVEKIQHQAEPQVKQQAENS
jgi:hypothetical protein